LQQSAGESARKQEQFRKCKQEYKGKTEFVPQRPCAKNTSLLYFHSDLNGKY